MVLAAGPPTYAARSSRALSRSQRIVFGNEWKVASAVSAVDCLSAAKRLSASCVAKAR